MRKLRRFLFGTPIHEEEAHHERLSKATALAVFSSPRSALLAAVELYRILERDIGLAHFRQGRNCAE